MTKAQIIGLIVVSIILIVVIVIIGKHLQTVQTETGGGGTNTVTKGLGDVFDFFSNLFKKKTYVTTGCDPNKPGYNLDGLYDNNCQ